MSKEDLNVKLHQYVESRGLDEELYNVLKAEAKEVFFTKGDNHQFVSDQLIKFVKKARLKHSLMQAIDIIEKDEEFESIPRMIENAIAVGYGADLGSGGHALMDLPERYRIQYAPSKLVRTGYKTFDDCLQGGMAPKEVHVIQAPPKSGKSTIGPNIGAFVTMTGKNIFHVSLEITEIEVEAKYAARLSNFTYKDFMDEKIDAEYAKRMTKFSRVKDNLFIKYWPELTVSCAHIRAWISRIRSETGKSPDLIIIDYDDCLLPVEAKVKAAGMDMYNEAGHIYSDLKELADYFNCPLLTFAQPQRLAWAKPNNYSLINSGDLAHSARKAHKATSVSSMNFAEGDDVGALFIDIVRRGVSKKIIPLRRDLTRGLIQETNESTKFSDNG